MAARASCPSMATVPNPRHLPVNTSLETLTERTTPNSENNRNTISSDASAGKLETNNVFNVYLCPNRYHCGHQTEGGHQTISLDDSTADR